MADADPKLTQYQTELEEARKHLADYQSGQFEVRSKDSSGRWVDATPAAITRLERTIAMYEALVEMRKARTGD